MVILAVIIIIGLILGLKYIPTSPTQQYPENSKHLNQETTLDNSNIINYKAFYKPKNYIITKKEAIFCNILFEIAKELGYMLFTQVSLYNILIMQDNLDCSTQTRYFNKIAAKSIDFVLTDKDYHIKLCIELDDETHKEAKRKERDLFINKLFEDLGINLLRYHEYPTYYKETLKKRILESITHEIKSI